MEHKFKKEHRYPGREEEVAARIVNKQRAQYGETADELRKDQEGKSPDRGLPVEDYQHLTIPQISSQLESLSLSDIRKIKSYEIEHKNRKGLLLRLDRRLRK